MKFQDLYNMNTDKKVFEKLFSNPKTELASQEYEFALADDVKAASKSLADSESKVKAAKIKAMQAIDSYNQFANGGVVLANSLGRLVDQLITKSKELGITPPNDLVALKQESTSKAKLYGSNLAAAVSASKTILQ